MVTNISSFPHNIFYSFYHTNLIIAITFTLLFGPVLNMDHCKILECGRLNPLLDIIIPPKNKCFRGYTGISLSFRLSVSVHTCNTIYSESAGRGIMSHLVTALVSITCTIYCQGIVMPSAISFTNTL